MGVHKEDDGGGGGGGGARGNDPNQHPNPRKGKSCRGILFYDSLLKLQSKDPICYGISESIPKVPSYPVGRSRLETREETRKLRKFSYSCTGYSEHLSNDGSSAGLADKDTELPFCVGLEISMDNGDDVKAGGHHDLDRKKERDLADNRQPKTHIQPPAQPQTRTSKPFPSPSVPPPDIYFDRFTRNAKLVAASMKKNMHRVVNRIKRSIDDINR